MDKKISKGKSKILHDQSCWKNLEQEKSILKRSHRKRYGLYDLPRNERISERYKSKGIGIVVYLSEKNFGMKNTKTQQK